MALEADLPYVLVRSVANPNSLLMGAFMTNLLCGPKVGGFQDPCDLGFPAEQSLLTYFTDLSGPALW